MKYFLCILFFLASINVYSNGLADDEFIEQKTLDTLNRIVGNKGRVSVKCSNRTLLLTGEIINDSKLIEEIQKMISKNYSDKNVINEIIIGGNISTMEDKENDLAFAKKIKNLIIKNNNFYENIIKVQVNNGNVYLMGQITENEKQEIVKVVQNSGFSIKGISLIFEYISSAERKEYLYNELANKEIRKKIPNNQSINIDNSIEPERKKLEIEKRSRAQATSNQRMNLQISNTQPDANGVLNISIKTNADTASLKINDEEQGGRADGNYTIKKVARAGQETKFTIVAVDVNGNTDSKTISVTRQVTASSQIKYAELNPALVKTQPNKDAVAIIIGVADYKKLPRADYANDDARIFYDYAIRGLGVKAENIKLLVDVDAEQGEIYKAFKTWLPARVKSTTDVYVYYSGHGLPSADGQTLYILPQLADRDLVEETGISQIKINAAIQATKPKSVTIFLDSCYSGAARTGQALLTSARPISLKANTTTFPSDFTVLTASTAEQISSSSNELKHGIFSYYLMKGMEGDADTNKDGKITAGEMQAYLSENVTKQASLTNRVQQPQLTGDSNRVLVGR